MSKRSKLLLKLAQAESVQLQEDDEQTDCGYESSPAPSLDVSFDIYSDDSVKDPSYSPSHCPSESSSDKRNSYTNSPVSSPDNVTNIEYLNAPCSVDIGKLQAENKILPKINIISDIRLQNISNSDFSAINTKKGKKKRTTCKFCLSHVTNFERHLERNHTDSKEVREMLSYPKKHIERKKIIGLIRNAGHFTEFLKGNVLPKYDSKPKNKEYYPCPQCKALLSKKYLSRHKKTCIIRDLSNANSTANQISASQTLIACSLDKNNTLHKLRVKEEVFSKMKADNISLVAKTDNLIYHFGENYLKKHKRDQLASVCSNKMRELARFLIQFREITHNFSYALQDILKPKLFDNVIECAKLLGGYDKEKKSYRSPSLSAHIGTSLKQVCELYIRLILKEDDSVVYTDKEQTIKDTKRFKDLIETQWTTEISSLAFKDLHEKQWEKPVMLPLTRDITKFKEFVTNTANKAIAVLETDPTNKKEFKNLVQASLTLTILFNRKRIGDVQYTKLKTYTEYINSVNLEECENVLSESEKILTKYYKRIVTGGKGSKPIAILFPQSLQFFIDMFIKIRSETNLVPQNNPYLFACPGTVKWTRGDVVIRKFAENANLEFPLQISSNKLRKQIATVMQVLNLSREETEQFAQFMGHTEKTHNEYYKLPQDVYQTAKVSKLLLLMEKGADSFKGKALAEIDIKPEEVLAEEDIDDNDEDIPDDRPFSLSKIPDKVNVKPLMTKPKMVTTGRTPWDTKQAELVKKHFEGHIKSKIAPKKDECLKLIQQYPDILHNKDWVRVKTFIYNTYRNK